MSIVISAVMPPTPVAGQAELALQAGAVVDARVVQVTAEGMARVAIANTLIDVMAAAPLAAGDTLRLAVAQTGEGVKLTIVSQNPSGAAQVPASRLAAAGNSKADAPMPASGEAPAPHATAVAQLVRDNVARQASLAPLFADLAKAAGRDDLPPQVRASAAQLLAMRPALSENLSAQELRAAVQRAGPFPQAAAPAAGSQSPPMPELKAALVVFRQVLAGWLTAETGSRAGQPQPLLTASQPVPQPVSQSAPQLATLPQMPAGSISPNPPANPMANPGGMTGSQGTASPPTSPQPLAGSVAIVPSGAEQMAGATVAATGKAAPGAPQPGAMPQTSAQAQLRQLSGGALLALLQEVQQEGRELARMTAEGKAGALDPLARLIRADARADQQAVLSAASAMPAGAIRANLPPPLAGGLPTPQPVAATGLGDNMSLADVGRKLLDDADGAIARQTLLQVASLPQGADTSSRAEAAAPRWNFEIPFATPQGTAVAQFEISRDGGRTAREDVRPVWQARFTISIEPVGPVHAQILLSGDRTSVRLWAERPQSAAALREGTQQLSRALKEADLMPGEILVGEGAPTPVQAGAAVRAGRYLDRAT